MSGNNTVITCCRFFFFFCLIMHSQLHTLHCARFHKTLTFWRREHLLTYSNQSQMNNGADFCLLHLISFTSSFLFSFLPSCFLSIFSQFIYYILLSYSSFPSQFSFHCFFLSLFLLSPLLSFFYLDFSFAYVSYLLIYSLLTTSQFMHVSLQ